MKKILKNKLLMLNYDLGTAKLNKDYKMVSYLKEKIDDYMNAYKKIIRDENELKIT